MVRNDGRVGAPQDRWRKRGTLTRPREALAPPGPRQSRQPAPPSPSHMRATCRHVAPNFRINGGVGSKTAIIGGLEQFMRRREESRLLPCN